MTDSEPRYPCPVCLGVRMEKVMPGQAPGLVLDYCPRCGGIWFDEGEASKLRKFKPTALRGHVTLGGEAYRMQCHSCHAPMERNLDRCPACDRRNVIDCPVCDRAMIGVRHGDLKLDACNKCRGVFFDNVELAAIWNTHVPSPHSREVGVALRDRPQDGALDVLDHFFLFSLLDGGWAPAIGSGVADAGGAILGSAGDVAGGITEGLGDFAGSVFEAIGDILGSFF